ncbi:MAG: hypothetical protein KAJ58_00370 [Candidatus Pacebacteria bacterium]|nr:hypothetical protein [Candidatus Paceibacterota bacterium]
MLNSKLKKIICKSFIIILLLGLFSISKADLDMNNQDINIKLNPAFPSAYQNVTVTTEIYITDIYKAKISWFIDGVLKSEGIGNKEFNFRTKNFGETTNLSVQVTSSDIGQLIKTFKIIPTELDLIWETDTFTPPFYKGKALNTHESTVKIVAIPNFINNNGVKIDPKELIYLWKKDWKISNSDSGYGKDSFSIVGPGLFKDNMISVEVTTLDGIIKNKKSILIRNNIPEVIFYENHPLLGILNNRNLKYFPVSNTYSEEIKIKVYPFYFSLYNKDNIKYEWLVNNKPVYDFKEDITLRREGEGTESYFISFKISDIKKFQLFTENDFQLNFK